MTEVDIAQYEGLIYQTAKMFHSRVGLEMDDMRQELRIKLLKSLPKYDPSRSRMTERKYAFACVTNFVKDLQRTHARRGRDITPAHIEDYDSLDAFQMRYQNTSHEQVYGAIDAGPVAFPESVTPEEQTIVLLIVEGFNCPEIAERLRVSVWLVKKRLASVREKYAEQRSQLLAA